MKKFFFISTSILVAATLGVAAFVFFVVPLPVQNEDDALGWEILTNGLDLRHNEIQLQLLEKQIVGTEEIVSLLDGQLTDLQELSDDSAINIEIMQKLDDAKKQLADDKAHLAEMKNTRDLMREYSGTLREFIFTACVKLLFTPEMTEKAIAGELEHKDIEEHLKKRREKR